MNTKHKKPTLTKKQRHKLRVQQVRRQKIFLTCLFLLIVGCILLRFSKFSGRQKETHQINAACEAYRDEVSSEAAQYDMSDYVRPDPGCDDAGKLPDRVPIPCSPRRSLQHQISSAAQWYGRILCCYPCGIQELNMLWKRPYLYQVRLIFPKSVWLCRHTISGGRFLFAYLEENGQTVWTAQSARPCSDGKRRHTT